MIELLLELPAHVRERLVNALKTGLLAAPYRPGAPTPTASRKVARPGSVVAPGTEQAGDLGDGRVAGLRSIAFGLKHKLDTLAYAKIVTGEGTPPTPAR
jgi:hypothetical protein